jgi:probable rRNA maturation factor
MTSVFLKNFSINTTGKDKLSGLSFLAMKEKVLGEDYDLALSFVNEKKIHELNKIYRNVDKPTDILSFPIDKNVGEIFICKKIANIKAKEFERTPENFLLFLFIHGLVHLKGFDHGNKMEKEESIHRKYFQI